MFLFVVLVGRMAVAIRARSYYIVTPLMRVFTMQLHGAFGIMQTDGFILDKAPVGHIRGRDKLKCEPYNLIPKPKESPISC